MSGMGTLIGSDMGTPDAFNIGVCGPIRAALRSVVLYGHLCNGRSRNSCWRNGLSIDRISSHIHGKGLAQLHATSLCR
jgi:hypothetical protein